MSEPARTNLKAMTRDQLKALFTKIDEKLDLTEPLTPGEMDELTQWVATQERIIGGNTKK